MGQLHWGRARILKNCVLYVCTWQFIILGYIVWFCTSVTIKNLVVKYVFVVFHIIFVSAEKKRFKHLFTTHEACFSCHSYHNKSIIISQAWSNPQFIVVTIIQVHYSYAGKCYLLPLNAHSEGCEFTVLKCKEGGWGLDEDKLGRPVHCAYTERIDPFRITVSTAAAH